MLRIIRFEKKILKLQDRGRQVAHKKRFEKCKNGKTGVDMLPTTRFENCKNGKTGVNMLPTTRFEKCANRKIGVKMLPTTRVEKNMKITK